MPDSSMNTLRFASCMAGIVALAGLNATTIFAADTNAAPASPPAAAPKIATNTNEALAGAYTLPDPLLLQNGTPVRDAKTWMEQRRPEILNLYREQIYGKSPAAPKMKCDVWDVDRHALGGTAIRKQIDISFP